MPSTTAKKPRTVERRVAFLFATFRSIELTPDGTYGEFFRTARRGELVTLDVTEAARLDSLGALGPAGCTVQDIEADIAASYQVYQNSRRNAPEGV